MPDREHAQGVLYLTAQAIKAFLAAFDPLEDRLADLVRREYVVRILLTAENPASRDPITYLIEIHPAPGGPDHEWTAEDEAFLRNLRVSATPSASEGQTDGGAAG